MLVYYFLVIIWRLKIKIKKIKIKPHTQSSNKQTGNISLQLKIEAREESQKVIPGYEL